MNDKELRQAYARMYPLEERYRDRKELERIQRMLQCLYISRQYELKQLHTEDNDNDTD